jgi:uncharacterized protein YceK
MKATAAILCAVLAVVASGCGSGSSGSHSTAASPTTPAPIHGTYRPSLDAASFVATVDNQYFPLVPGTAFHYEGTSGGTPQTDDMVVTHRKVRILGIPATAVLDTVSEHGRAIERTVDFYAQDKRGNVWYLGEDSYEREHGRFVKADDSWRSGVSGAQPGIIMLADPRAGAGYRQEYYPPKALDEARVLGMRGPVEVPYRKFDQALATSEFSPAEPQTEEKYYASGVGEISEHVVKGDHEEFRLVRVTHRTT